jgi:signal transduction histidine kinase
LENERLAAEVRAQVQEVRASRVRLVNAADAQRRRIERELQVGAQQRLASMVLALRMLSDRLDGRANPAAVEMIDRARDEARGALEDLRELARGLHPQVLTQEGLGAALELLCERSPVPVRLLGVRVGRLPEPVEAAAYFVCSEALTNVAKYAQATNVSVDLQVAGGRLEIEVVDDGVGGAHRDAGSGLRGLADRLDALGGRLNVRSPAGRGTQVRAWIPTADRTAEIAVEPPPLAVGARS